MSLDLQTAVSIVLPIITLILGYLLKYWTDAKDSQREQDRRRIADREKAYAEISAVLHELFETYRVLTLKANMHRISPEEFRLPYDYQSDEEEMVAQYDKLQQTVFSNSLYLKPEILQDLLDLKVNDFRRRFKDALLASTSKETIEAHELHADQMWSDAKTILSKMRVEIGLDPYPDDVLKMWR